MRPLTVLNVAYSAAPVGPEAVGGAEVVLSCLDQALVAAGHRSLVVACQGSRAAGTLVASAELPRALTPESRMALCNAHRAAIARALDEWPVDVVHLHGVDAMSYLPARAVPTLLTLHLSPDRYPAELFTRPPEHLYFNCVSASQRHACPQVAELLGVVENGVPFWAGDPPESPGDYAVAIGRLCPEKGFHLAIEAARAAGLPLVLAGSVFSYPEHIEYFRTQIAPGLAGACRFIGPVSGERKVRLLAGARCLLVTSLVPETSSLVAMESLACGTPVVAFPAGALPEVIEHGRTGLMVNTVSEMAAAIHQVGQLDRNACRRAARERFDAERMCRQYLALYARLASPPTRRTDGGHTAGSASSHVRAETISSVAELEQLRDEWEALWARCPDATPFQSPAWLLPWYHWLGSGTPCGLALRRNGELVGLAPLVVDSCPSGERRLRLAGTGVSDYLDVLLAPRSDREVLRVVWEFLRDGTDQFDLCDLQQLRPDGRLARGLTNWLAAEHRRPDEPCPVLALPPGAGLQDCLPAAQSKRLAYYRRRLCREGPAAIEEASESTFDEFLTVLIAAHAARWRERNQPGVLRDLAVQQFHRDAGRRLLESGVLRLNGLRLCGRLIAAYYGFLSHRRAYYYLGGFDPDCKHLSPGILLVGHAIESALAEGAVAFDFLRGREAYKYAWGSRDRGTCRWCFPCFRR